MKNPLKTLFKLLIIGQILFLPISTAHAEPKKKENDESHKRIEALDELSFVEMLTSVDVGKNSDLIQKFQNKEGKTRLLNGKYNPKGECSVEAYRNKEVLLITIPAHLLFAPNATDLKSTASDYLTPIRRYLKDPDMYRVMLVMHTDNTGSPEYRDQLTADRVNSIFDWFEDSGSDTRYLFSYALGDDMPLKKNDSMENREKNRRLEIYLIPGSKMVEQAAKGRIAF